MQALQRSEGQLAGPNSRFIAVEGVRVHYTVCRPPGLVAACGGAAALPAAAPACAVHCVHGLGAHTFSWLGYVQAGLAERLGAIVTAHDQCGFGLTQR